MKYSKRNHFKNYKLRNRILFTAATIVILFIAVLPIVKSIKANQVPEGAIKMELSMGGFSPNVIEAKAGETIDIYLINLDNQYHRDGGGWHQFASDTLDFNYNIGPKKKELVSITVTEPGEYLFYCDVCCGGKESITMQGKIIVT